MVVRPAEDSFQQGMQALISGRRKEALARFEAAIEIERRMVRGAPQARYLSFYGLCLARERLELREGLRFCREAVTLEGFNPDLRLNLGRLLLQAGRRKEAYQTILRGLWLQPDHRGLKTTVRRMGVRRRPPIPFLGRANPLNVLLGRYLSRAATPGPRRPGTAVSPGFSRGA